MKTQLAYLGGKPVRSSLFPGYITIDQADKEAVLRVLNSGKLSQFLGVWGDHFYGGAEVRALEQEWSSFYKIDYANAVNSATSGLLVALGAAGVSPGDEVIVSPYSMSASAVTPLFYGAIPVFADIEPDYFCLDPKAVVKKITRRTKAIIVVDIFGQPFAAKEIMAIARKHHLVVIEDAAQAPGAIYHGQPTGTLADIGVYSLNYHKHIHTGEGGVVVTRDQDIAQRVQLIRNHAESVVEKMGVTNLTNMIGLNLRMTEIEAAIAREQLKKLPELLEQRQENVSYLTTKLRKLPGLTPALIRENCTHAFYVHPIIYNEASTGVKRHVFAEAIKAELKPMILRESEGVTLGEGYVKPLYLLPTFQQKIAFGNHGYPWKGQGKENHTSYEPGICPVAEKMHFSQLITHEYIHAGMARQDLDDVVAAFTRVSEHIDELSEVKL